MAHPLMPKATAVWLVDNTMLTFKQIAEFVGLHELEVQAIADGDDEEDAQATDTAVLQMSKVTIPQPKARQKGARYTPVSKRGDRPNAIAWLVKNYPELSDAQISKLIGTTKPTIASVRDRSHWNSSNIKGENPVSLGLCNATDLEKAVALARARSKTVHAPRTNVEATLAAVAQDAATEAAAEPTEVPASSDSEDA